MANEQFELPFNASIMSALTPKQTSRVRAELYEIAEQIEVADGAWARAIVASLLDPTNQEKSDEADRLAGEANVLTQRLMQLTEPSCMEHFVRNLL